MQLAIDSGFVHEHSLHGFERIQGGYMLEGEIACLGGIVIAVRKIFETIEEASDDDIIITKKYKYNACVRGVSDSTFLRYDNAHAHPNHQDEYHRHDIDWKTGKKLAGSPTWIGLPDWPNLSDFIDMVQVWYEKNKSDLPNPGGYPPLGQRHGTTSSDDELDE